MLPLRRALTCLESRDRSRHSPKSPESNDSFKPLGLLVVEQSAPHQLAGLQRSFGRRSNKMEDKSQDMDASISVDSIKATLVVSLEDGPPKGIVLARSPPSQVPCPSIAEILENPETARFPAQKPVKGAKSKDLPSSYTFNWVRGPSQFQQLVDHCQRAIDRNVHPLRISQGSSGSYFIKDEYERIVGVFKPKDEEPYGQFNPRWIKWLHRTCCPCLFGRSFLTPNTGYISEAAASLVDTFLGLNVVPQTQIAHLSSAAFVFPWWEHYRVWRGRMDDPSTRYPLKLGSFQLFVSDFEQSSVVLGRLNELRPLEPEIRNAFQAEFERMTILDYAIRNSDRSLDNWLIHFSWIEDDTTTCPKGSNSTAQSTIAMSDMRGTSKARSETDLGHLGSTPRLKPRVKIACIDNGLAFPFKHPDEWRSYPYSWASLPEAKVPYSQDLSRQLLPLLTDTTNWESLVGRLKLIFQIDSDFDERTFRKQMAILRGQLHNIVQVLQCGGSPMQLVEMPLLLIDEDEEVLSSLTCNPITNESFEGHHKAQRRHRHTPVTTKPLFSCW